MVVASLKPLTYLAECMQGPGHPCRKGEICEVLNNYIFDHYMLLDSYVQIWIMFDQALFLQSLMSKVQHSEQLLHQPLR